MKRMIVSLTFAIALLIVIYVGLYTYLSAVSVLINTLILSFCIGYRKERSLFLILLWITTSIFTILLIIGSFQINLPVAEQSLFMAIFMVIFVVVQIGVSIVGLVMVFMRESHKFRLNDIIIVILPVTFLGLYLGFKGNYFIYLTLLSLLISLIIVIRKG